MENGKINGVEPADVDVVPGLGISPKEAMTAKLRKDLGAGKSQARTTAVMSELLRFEELVAAGLPDGDRLVELAMLYRKDCPVDFLRESRFQWEVMNDPALPVTTARAVLAANPTAAEIRQLSRRKDLTSKELQLAAVKGRARARWQGKSGADFAALRCLPGGWVELTANGVDDEIVGLLRNPNCPENVVRRYLTAGAARVRLCALIATQRRDLPIESSLVIAARDLPMSDSAKFPRRDRVVDVANRILAAR